MKQITALPLLTAAALMMPACTQILSAAMPPPGHDAKRAPAGTYMVETNHTQVIFSVLHLGFTQYYGNFSGVSGTLAYTPKHPADMSVSISVPVASIQTTSPVLTSELKAPDWLDAATYPTMVFRSTKVTQTGPNAADIDGTLTLHGVTKPLTLHATFIGDGMDFITHKQTIGFQLSGALKRSDFGVAKYVPVISDEVTLTIAAAFTKA
jgi:polyisoprenoid-binding protein YceI